MTLTKNAPVHIKAVTESGDKGIVDAIVSVFDVKDYYGDVIIQGAFTRTLGEWSKSGDPIPVYWSHRTDDPEYNIGIVLDAGEVEAKDGMPGGLFTRQQYDLDQPKAKRTFELLKARRVKEFSFAYGIQAAGMASSAEHGDYYELRDLDLFEVGPTPKGANPATELIDVKSLDRLLANIGGVKSGRVLSSKNENALRAAYDSIGTVLSALDVDEKAAPPEARKGNGMAHRLRDLELLAADLDLAAL